MRNRFITLVVVSGLMLMSCGGDDSAGDVTAPAPDTTEQVQPEAAATTEPEPEVTEPEPEPEVTEPDPEVTEPEPEVTGPEHTIEIVDCEQVAIYLPVDAAKAAERIPDDVELVVENGKIISLFLAHECGDVLVDGVSAGPAHINNQWLPVPGPAEVREVPEHEGVSVLPTAYWYPLVAETDNSTFQQLAGDVDLDMTLVDAIVFNSYVDLDDRDVMWTSQDGEVVSADPEVGYMWTVGLWGEVALVDQTMVMVHIAGNLETEMLAHVRVSHDAILGQLGDAAGPDEPIGQNPEDAGKVFVTVWDRMVFDVTTGT